MSDLRISHAKSQRRQSSDATETNALKKQINELEESLGSMQGKSQVLESQLKDATMALEEEKKRSVNLLAEAQARETKISSEFTSYKKRAQQIISERGNQEKDPKVILELEQKNDILSKELQ